MAFSSQRIYFSHGILQAKNLFQEFDLYIWNSMDQFVVQIWLQNEDSTQWYNIWFSFEYLHLFF